ncbi:MAG: tetratricopeptide repeat protein [Paludibacteraceae bacterium]
MNKKILFFAGIITALAFTSCNKNLKTLDASYFKTTPNPLEMKGDKVDATVTGTFPTKYFRKNAEVTVTPVLKFSGDEQESASKSFQGEKVLGNNQAINYKAGGTYTINPTFDYTPEMAKSELFLNFDVTQGKKKYTLPAVKIADGVIATSYLASTSPDEIKSAIAPDNFQRVTQETQDADILFLIQQAQLRSSELNQSDIIAFNQKVQEARDAQNKEITNLEVLGYASPDGPIDLNTNLAEKRQAVTTDYLNKELKKLQADVMVDSKFTAEDWDGFQKLMEASNIQDKDLILRVLSMYQDPEQREREIKNLSATFSDVANEILPQLRRSRLNLTVDVTGKSDAEILNLAGQNPQALAPSELLYAATLVDSYREKEKIYNSFIELNPNDARGYNNKGVVLYELDQYEEASKLFKEALELNPNSPDANFNSGMLNLALRKVADAQVYFGKSAGTTGNLDAALGTSYIAQGDYVKAQNVLRNVTSNNAALAQILNSDYNTARNTLSAVANPNATTAYLAAVIAARTNDRDGVYNNLRTAIQRNVSYAKKAVTDLEFAKYFTDQAFMNIVK